MEDLIENLINTSDLKLEFLNQNLIKDKIKQVLSDLLKVILQFKKELNLDEYDEDLYKKMYDDKNIQNQKDRLLEIIFPLKIPEKNRSTRVADIYYRIQDIIDKFVFDQIKKEDLIKKLINSSDLELEFLNQNFIKDKINQVFSDLKEIIIQFKKEVNQEKFKDDELYDLMYSNQNIQNQIENFMKILLPLKYFSEERDMSNRFIDLHERIWEIVGSFIFNKIKNP